MGLMFQVKLRRHNAEQVTWIPARGAKVGNMVELTDEGDGEFWRVVQVFDYALDEKVLREKQAMDRGSLASIKG
jgi:hypothetical protein